jgi:hypothetical protein
LAACPAGRPLPCLSSFMIDLFACVAILRLGSKPTRPL